MSAAEAASFQAPEHPKNKSAPAFWQKLLHRWFIEFNPLYLVSAACVLAGVTLISRGLAYEDGVFMQVAVAAIADVYAFALIGGAALLTRLGLRRPAVMLALLAALYQGDLTLHTETCAYLGHVGLTAGALWWLSFIAKLHALAWAMRLTLSRSALAVAALGAFGLVVLPHVVLNVGTRAGSELVGLWVFALFALALWTTRGVRSAARLDGWAATVLRRATRAAWILWTVLVLWHLRFWSNELGFDPTVLLPVALLLTTRWMRSEAGVWATVLGALLAVGLFLPTFFSVSALVAAAVFALRAFRVPEREAASDEASGPRAPYRTASSPPPENPARKEPHQVFVFASPAAISRLLVGSGLAFLLALWTSGWTGGAWPEHVFALDALATLGLLVVAWRLRSWSALGPLGGLYLHLAVQTETVTSPASVAQWGVLTVGVGFVLLLASLLTTWRLKSTHALGVDP